VREYLLTLMVAAATTYLLVGLAGRLAHRVGAVPPLRDRDVHRVPIPRLGGPAMLAGIGAAFLVASELPRMRQVFERYDDAQGLLTAAVVICLVGVIDDIWELDPLTKLAGQVLAAALLTVQGVQFLWIPLPSGPFVLGQAQGVILTVLFVVTVMNAVNFVDGLDGLAAGVVGIGSAAFFVFAYLLSIEQSSRMNTPALVCAVLTGVCLGFLPHNVAPARIFMGDSGSMLLGLFLAAGSVVLTGHYQSADPTGATASFVPALLPLVLPLAIVAIPILDLVMAVVRRTRAGLSPFSADQGHLHHRLIAIGHSHRRVVLILWLWSAVLSFGLVAAGLVGGWLVAVALVAAVLAAVVVTTRGAVSVRRA
jgi:UDP-GlcNAc:undecaprenyl-phosphate GlcNAc-1-phosphate transferase